MTSYSRNRKIIKDKNYMQWVVENHPCFVCYKTMAVYNNTSIQFHHLQGKYRIGAMIRDDSTGIPICYHHHHELTFKYGERNFWDTLEIDPLGYAQSLYIQYKERTNDKRPRKTRSN
jgi:hypothetical protein